MIFTPLTSLIKSPFVDTNFLPGYGEILWGAPGRGNTWGGAPVRGKSSAFMH